ncbi:hypothetical protein [Blattabacterium cuenoti]|uniref:hypothetical protein n=1 Tax=Blattabacterium cuenoti TaxID=1653831 RepID=UPI00163C5D79|nr:hypothetical protein [Blattabacterium cuenoti]
MNTSFRFLIPTIFVALGFIVSCNDDNITSAGEEEPGVNKNTPTTMETPSTTDPPPTIASNSTSSTTTEKDPENPDNFKLEDIDPEDLSIKIKEVGDKIEELEKENAKHYEEYSQMVKVQKRILDEIIKKKKIMRSKTVGSEEELQAKKEFEDHKKYGKEKLKLLKEKNVILYHLIKSIAAAKNEQKNLQKKQEYFLKKQKENQN